MTHLCHHPECSARVPPRMFMCKPHWFSLPKPTRDAIWREYRSGQERDKRPSLRYLAVQRFAIGQSLFKPHDEEAARNAVPYLFAAIGYQQRCIHEGLGDPLEGLMDVSKLLSDGDRQWLRDKVRRAGVEQFVDEYVARTDAYATRDTEGRRD